MHMQRTAARALLVHKLISLQYHRVKEDILCSTGREPCRVNAPLIPTASDENTSVFRCIEKSASGSRTVSKVFPRENGYSAN
jgi:hypothetical protein